MQGTEATIAVERPSATKGQDHGTAFALAFVVAAIATVIACAILMVRRNLKAMALMEKERERWNKTISGATRERDDALAQLQVLRKKLAENETTATEQKNAETKRPDHSAWALQMPMFIRQATLTHVACSLGGWKTTASTDATVLIPDGPQMLLSQGWDVGCQTATLNCCRGCEACRPVRIDVSIPPSRRERRAIAIPKKVAWTQPQALDDEHLALLKRHRVARLGIHDLPDPVKILQPGTPGGWTSVLDLRNENGTLLAFIVIAMYPRGVAFARIHAFDPTAGGSLGTAIIAIAVSGLARGRIGTTHLYLGNTSAAEWNYKAKFAGSEILGRTGWVRAGADVDKLLIPPPATKDEIDGKTEKKT